MAYGGEGADPGGSAGGPPGSDRGGPPGIELDGATDRGGNAAAGADEGSTRSGGVGLFDAARRLGARLALRSSIASRPTRGLYWATGPRVTRSTYDCDLDAYRVPLDPFRLVRVDPDLIARLSRRPFPPDRGARQRFGTVRGGEWDRRPIDETPTESPVRHLFDGPTIERTPLYRLIEDCVLGPGDPLEHPFGREVADRLAHGEFPVWGDCRMPADVRDRVRQLRAHAGRLLAADAGGATDAGDETDGGGAERDGGGGTPTQRELALRGTEPARRRDFLAARANEILVDVARDGELLVAGGLERLCLARSLGIERVPVGILVRHDRWVAECEWRWLEDESLGEHPDLWDLGSADSTADERAPEAAASAGRGVLGSGGES